MPADGAIAALEIDPQRRRGREGNAGRERLAGGEQRPGGHIDIRVDKDPREVRRGAIPGVERQGLRALLQLDHTDRGAEGTGPIGGVIRATVAHDQNFEAGPLGLCRVFEQRFQRAVDHARLVVGGDDDRD